MRTPTVRTKIAELLRLNASVSERKQLSLKGYVDRMKEELDINATVGESIAAVYYFLVLGILHKMNPEEKVQKTVEIPQVQ